MADSIGEKREIEAYSEQLHSKWQRLFDPDLPAGAVARVKTLVEVELRFLARKDEGSTPRGSGKWFQEFLDKDGTRRKLDELRESIARVAERERVAESDASSAAPTPPDRVKDLSNLLETDPRAARSRVLDGLTDADTDHPWRRLLVIAAEGIRFTDDQDRELLPALTAFIHRFRDSNDRENQIAVCSAIRTCVGLTPTTQIESVGAFLEPGHRAYPSLDTLLETVKMIARKFAANPPESPNEHPTLSCQLERLARAYMSPYVLPHGKNAALAMNALQAVVGSASPGMHGLIADANTSCPAWFRQQLQRRLRRLLREWEARLGDRATEHQPTNLVQEAIDRLEAD